MDLKHNCEFMSSNMSSSFTNSAMANCNVFKELIKLRDGILLTVVLYILGMYAHYSAELDYII